jgi:hypothetical protein
MTHFVALHAFKGGAYGWDKVNIVPEFQVSELCDNEENVVQKSDGALCPSMCSFLLLQIKMSKLHCIHQIVAYHGFKNLEFQGRVKVLSGAAKKGAPKKLGRPSKAPPSDPTPKPTEGGTMLNPINRKQTG